MHLRPEDLEEGRDRIRQGDPEEGLSLRRREGGSSPQGEDLLGDDLCRHHRGLCLGNGSAIDLDPHLRSREEEDRQQEDHGDNHH